jgi:S-formylglutathione hydrolase FrmB
VAERPVPPPVPLPEPVTISSDAAGSSIASITYTSHALGWRDRYLVYLPPGYRASGTRRYPVLYLLHGDNEPASSFLRLGLQPTLDRLIRSHATAPLIAVMLQGAGLTNNWRNTYGAAGRTGPQYNAYISEVQRLTDRVLRTIPNRASRGIAGYSMGGFGAMNVALSQLGSYSVVESWEGFFNNLSGQLAADRPLLARMPLHAFVYGGRSDRVAGTSQNAPWAAALRSAGAEAQSALYPGGHTFTPLEQHLQQMLSFAGRALQS